MSMILRIKGADFSDSGLPKLTKQIQGFVADASLLRLYLFEDREVGDGYPGPAYDSSDNLGHAVFLNGLGAARVVGGVETTGENHGFWIDTGVPYADVDFTVFGVTKNDMAPSAPHKFPTLWGSTAGIGTGFGTGNPSYTRGLFLNQLHSTIHTGVDLGLFAPAGWGERATIYRTSASVGGTADINGWVAWAITYDAETGLATLRYGNATKSATDAGIQAAMPAVGGNHAFGYARYGGDPVDGKAALFGVYQSLLSSSEVQVLLAKARAAVTGRGEGIVVQ